MPVWLVAFATLLGSAIIPALPTAHSGADDVLVFEASSFQADASVGLSDQGGALSLAGDAPASPAYPESGRFGVAETQPRALAGPSALRDLAAVADTPAGSSAIVEA